MSGILGRLLTDGTTNQSNIYTVPANTRTTFFVSIVNLGVVDAVCEIFLKQTGDGDYQPIQTVFKRTIVAGETYATVSFALGAGQSILVKSDQGDIVFNASGVEKEVAV